MRRATVLCCLILLGAAFLRLVALHDSPPGLQHDEMFKALEGYRLAEAGDFRIFYPTNQGHEGGYVWALGLSIGLLGLNAFAVKFPAFVFGMLTVALTMRLTGKLVNRRAALVAGGLCAVSFFAIFTSRVGLRAVMLPVFVLWLLLALQAILTRRNGRVLWPAVSAGLALGLSIYTYTSAFALWGGVAALVVALALFDRYTLRSTWQPLALVVIIGGVVSLPMIIARATDPDGFNRSSSISRPLTDALAGQPQELIDNGVKLLGMAAFTGDPEARYNVPTNAFYPLIVGLAAYVGIAIAVWRLRKQPLYAALLGIMAVGLVPSLLTVSAPSFLRSIALLPGLMLCVALAISVLPRRAGTLLGVVAVVAVGVRDIPAYFGEWPRLPEVNAIYRDDLEQLARAAKGSDGIWLVSTPDVEQDALLFSIYAGDAGARVVFFDGDTTVAVSDGAHLAISPLAPLTRPHLPFTQPEYGAQSAPAITGQGAEAVYTVYNLTPSQLAAARVDGSEDARYYIWPDNEFERAPLADWATGYAYPVNFGGMLELSAAELAQRPIAREFDGVNLQLFLRPLVDRPDAPLSMFVHVYRQNNGRLHAQRDLMGMPSSQWLRGVTAVQDNFVIMGPSRPGAYLVAAGVYNVATGERLPVLAADGTVLGDRVLLGQVIVEE